MILISIIPYRLVFLQEVRGFFVKNFHFSRILSIFE